MPLPASSGLREWRQTLPGIPPMTMAGSVGLALSCLALAGDALLLWAAVLVHLRAHRTDAAGIGKHPAVSVLKPLHGAEPRLRANLATALDQNYRGEAEILCGTARADDPAAGEVLALAAGAPAIPIRLVTGTQGSGANGKIGNLTVIFVEARYDVIVFADSDMAVPQDYLSRLSAELSRPGVGAVTCLYVGRGDAGFWSRLVAAGIDTHFVPASLIGLASGLGHPCMGSTIALTRPTLNAIGGFERFANVLADDHAIGAAVRARGLGVAVPALTLTHACRETSLARLLRQELRWNATLRGIDPWGYAGSMVLHPLPLALLGLAFGGGRVAITAAILALLTRAIIAIGAAQTPAPARSLLDRWLPLALVPVRDLVSFLIFVLAFLVRSVDWRGASLNLEREGRIAAPRENRA
jgi:ceramide glucosyltransferase